MIKLSDINFTYDRANTFRLKNVNFDLKRGDIHFVTGVSGAGKSTLLKIMAQSLMPQGGRIQSKRGLFFTSVEQDLKLIDHLSGLENILFSYDFKLSKNVFLNEVHELAKALDIENELRKKISKMNGGLRQKIAIIRAIVSHPDIILLDEPSSNLDQKSAKNVFEVLNFYNRRNNLTFVWATHDSNLVKKYPGKITHLEKGNIVYSGHACFI